MVSQNREGDFRFYQYDGLGSTRALSNSAGDVTDSYHYEAFGEALNETGTTDNNYKFTGEQFDASLDQYYLRARYYNQGIGRFTQQDTYMGNNFDPVSLHKYLYANADPLSYTDPTGNWSLGSAMASINMMGNLASTVHTGYNVFNMAAGDEITAKDVGISVLLNMLSRVGGKTFLRLFSKKGCKKNKCKPVPVIDNLHIFKGEIVNRTAKGFHSSADPSYMFGSKATRIIKRWGLRKSGVYMATAEIWDDKTKRYRLKKVTTMFPDRWSKAQVSAALYKAWEKNKRKNTGLVRVSGMKIRYHIEGVYLRGFPIQ